MKKIVVEDTDVLADGLDQLLNHGLVEALQDASEAEIEGIGVLRNRAVAG